MNVEAFVGGKEKINESNDSERRITDAFRYENRKCDR